MNFKSAEARELQDMYRRTLAASFAAQAGELPADECIESIFAGGSGWRDTPPSEAKGLPGAAENERHYSYAGNARAGASSPSLGHHPDVQLPLCFLIHASCLLSALFSFLPIYPYVLSIPVSVDWPLTPT
jgi:hypothetical protein